jgi:hypothetical protein
MYVISNFILIGNTIWDLMMYKYVLTHQPNLVGLYALDRSARSSPTLPRGRLLVVAEKHIMGAIGGRLIRIQHREFSLMGRLALPWIRPLSLPRNRHLALPRSRHLSLPRLGQREPVILRLTIKST